MIAVLEYFDNKEWHHRWMIGDERPRLDLKKKWPVELY